MISPMAIADLAHSVVLWSETLKRGFAEFRICNEFDGFSGACLAFGWVHFHRCKSVSHLAAPRFSNQIRRRDQRVGARVSRTTFGFADEHEARIGRARL